jgi:hypothetical protein
MVLLLWAATTPIISRPAASSIQGYCALGLVGTAIPVGVAAALFGMYSILGRMFSVGLAQQFSGLGASALLEQASFQISPSAVAFAMVSAVTILLVHLSASIEVNSHELHRQLLPPQNRTL